MRIGDRQIGTGEVFVIAEIGVNHDGKRDVALRLVEAAARAGADAVKFQMFEATGLMSRASRLAGYQSRAGERDPVEMLRRLELSDETLTELASCARAAGICPIVTVFSLDLVDRAARMGWSAFKTASPDIVHRPLLEALASRGLPLILSTGASTLAEVERATQWLSGSASTLAALQCVSSYPTPPEHAELDGIAALRGLGLSRVGYSDHTREVETGAEAVRRGAVILEKHFTHDTRAPGPDHAASLDEAALQRYVREARAARPVQAALLQPGLKRVLDIERDVRRVSRQSIVTRRALRIGETIVAADLTFKRPGTGLAPYEIDRVLGRTVRREVEADVPLTPEDVGLPAGDQEGATHGAGV